MKLKVCGIRSVEQMAALESLGVDFAGMIFYEKSARYAGNLPQTEKEAIKKLAIKKVGVFVNADYDTILKAIEEFNLYAVQLHGDETDEFCLELMGKAKVIKAFRVADQTSIDELVNPFQAVCDYYLFDTAPSIPQEGSSQTQNQLAGESEMNSISLQSEVRSDASANPPGGRGAGLYGGTGQQFDWKILETATIDKPFFLSGGIGLEDAGKLQGFQHLCLYAVDVNSRFEIEPGQKDLKMVEQFVKAISHE